MHRTKLESRARKCVFLGYKNGMKGVVLYDIHSHSILISRNVIHYEHIFPYSNSNSINWDYHLHKDSIEHFQHDPVIYVPSQNIEPTNDEHDNQHTIANDTLHHSNSDPETVENTDENNDTQHILDTHDTENYNTQSRPVRTKQTPHYLSDYVCNISDVSAVKSSSGSFDTLVVLETEELWAIYELHIWAITVEKVLLVYHVKINPVADADAMLDKVVDYNKKVHNINHVTIQIDAS
ncbi:hypothetical protein KIW84_024635 [Lathyrus oleraceus]|uniref:Uncharacterized protein n=1 Tax=Pisum sativum TaxID=3888 RepID=A0A9D4YH13_PEA|nr:hypothetical protein KIW84_024635 [Pisum sativum]